MRKFVVATMEDGHIKYCTKEWNYGEKGLDKIPVLGTKTEACIYYYIGIAFDDCDAYNLPYKKTKPYFVMQT